nr:S8 family serine peptidase [Acidobacteriota bacterium]
MLRRITASLILLSLISVSVAPLTVSAAPATQKSSKRQSKLAPEFDSAAKSSNLVRVIVQTKGRPSAAQESAIKGKGGAHRGSFDELDALTADVPQSALAELAAREDVDYISPDRTVTGQLAVTRETTGAALAQAGQTQAQGLTGKGVGIAIIDSGISVSHPDFQNGKGKSRIVASVDFTRGGSVQGSGILMSDSENGDKDGHGTGVASVAAGSGAASRGYAGSFAGIAPGADIINLKALGDDGTGSTSGTMAAVSWAIANRKRFNIRVINMSLGTPVRESFHTDPLCKAVARAIQSGIVVVASAGNGGRTEEIIGHKENGDPIYRALYGSINSPGNSPYVITVGASDSHGTARRSDDTMAQFSAKGPTRFDHIAKPDLVAPGRGIVAAMSQENPNTAQQRPDRVAQTTANGALANVYYTYYGTSFSAPVVSGTIALMLEANKSLTPVLVKASLLRTANALPTSLFGNGSQSVLQQGAGQVNAAAAVEMARAIVPNADKLKSESKIFRSGVTLSSLGRAIKIGGESVAPSSRVLYSNGVLFNERPVLMNGIMLSDGILMSD